MTDETKRSALERALTRPAIGLLLLLLVQGFFLHFWPKLHTANESIRFYFVESVVQEGTLSIDPAFDRYAPGWRERKYPPRWDVPGAYESTVGLISLGMIGRKTVELLQPFDLHILAYSTSTTPSAAAEMGIDELCSLDDVFRRADVVSLHTPWLPETENMIAGDHLRLMKPGATFINTARGAVVNEREMISVLQERDDLWAILDVTHPEPLEAGSPLYSLPNVVLTPHIAGSMSAECRRMGRYMVDELERYLRGEPLRWAISEAEARRLA